MRGYTDKQVERAKDNELSLFKWQMDKRFVADINDRIAVTVTGTMTAEKASRIFRIIQEEE